MDCDGDFRLMGSARIGCIAKAGVIWALFAMSDPPQTWMRNVFNVQPVVYWPWRHSLRLALITTVPLTIGFLCGNAVAALFVCLGGLLSAISVQTDPYRDRFNRIFTAVPFGIGGFAIGSVIAEQGLLTIAGVVLIAMVSGWISFWGKTFSAGALQMLIMTVVASHATQSSLSMTMPLLFGLGALYAALLLGIEAILIPKQPERKLTSLLFASLANLARVASRKPKDNAEIKTALHEAIEAQANAYSVILRAQTRKADGSEDFETGKKILTLADRLIVVLATQQADAGNLSEVAQSLELMSKAVLKPGIQRSSTAPALENGAVATLVAQMWELACAPLWFVSSSQTPSLRSLSHELGGLNEGRLRAQFEAPRSDLVNIFSLALCMLIAMLAEFYLPGNRSYWIPLSVAVILKPDFGSVFVRSLQRSAGTMVGVLLGILIFYLVPKGLCLVVVVGLLSAIIPWASLKNYAWQCAFLTPLILILIDLIVAGPTVDYGPQRLIDTFLGAVIVLVFGYFIWPKPVKVSFATRYDKPLKAIAKYIDGLRGASQSSFDDTVEERHNIYVEIFGLRKWVQSFLAEPPPTSKEALLWLPRIDDAEQLVGRVDDYLVGCEAIHKLPETAKLDAFIAEVDKLAPAAEANDIAISNPGSTV
ncbi:membrane protein [Brucella sp. NBRC 12950]|nr:membrane protein [Brucella sp. NBRC 12950]